MNFPSPKPVALAVLSLGLAVALTGCQTVDPTAAGKFATTTAAVKTQADTALASVASLTRDASVQFAATQSTLNESNFIAVPNGDTIAAWDKAFNALNAYAQNLANLTAPGATQDFDAAATKLYGQFNDTAAQLKVSAVSAQPAQGAFFAAAFTSAADAILRARGQATALEVARTTDTNIAAICQLFVDEIGPDLKTMGLRKTLNEAVWRPRLAVLYSPFRTASESARVTLAQQFADLLAKRDAQDQILASLRASLLALADAHHHLAAGQTGSLQADLAAVTTQIQHTHDLYDQFSKLNRP